MRELEVLKEAISAGARRIGDATARDKSTVAGVYDAVTDSDVAAEKAIIERIRAEFPYDAIVSEETNPDAMVSGRTWIIDPIDGTVNFSRGMPLYGMQGVFVEDGEPRASVIYLPALGEEYWASEEGAFLNGAPIKTAAPAPLGKCILTTGDFSRRSEDFRLAQARLMSECRDEVARFKMLGAACMDFAYLAAGRSDIHVRFTNKPWDFMPGLYLAEKAGAVYDKELMERTHILILCSSQEVLEESRERILPHIMFRIGACCRRPSRGTRGAPPAGYARCCPRLS